MTPPVKKTPEATPPAPEKVEAKAEVKVETPPPAPVEENPDAFSFTNLGSYSLRLEGGYGWRNFGNDQGMDHGGGYVRPEAGLRFRFGRHSISPRIFFEHQSLGKDLGEGITSDAKVNTIGVLGDYGIAAIPTWLSFHGKLGLGAAFYSSPDTTDGINGGAEFNKNPQKAHLTGTAFRIDLGLDVCTWGDAICLGAGYAIDQGLNPKIEVVDGNFPPMGLNPAGFKVGVGVDLMAMAHNIWGKKETKKPKPAEEGPKPAPDGDKKPVNGKPADVKPGDAKPAAPKLAGIALFEQRVKETKTNSEKAKAAAETAKKDLKELKTEKDAEKSKALTTDAVYSFRQALANRDEADAYVAELKNEVEKLEGEDKKKAQGLLKEAQANADAANTQAREAHDAASAAVKQYNKGKGAAEQVDFPDSKPELRGKPPAGKPKPKDDKPKPKDDKPKDDKPKDDKPKDDKPKADKPKDPGGVIDFGTP